MTIRPGVPADLATVQAWLVDAGLPVADLTPDHMNDFLVAVVDAGPAGMIGLEQIDEVGLLRSLVIDPAVRRGGIGRQLVAALEAHALASGIAELWLLTIDAEAYFLKLGYEVMERDRAPAVIRATREFSSLCPGDAVLMQKVL
jgi:N-acetylglutamate synthase-like GNAT family acetyltransferase